MPDLTCPKCNSETTQKLSAIVDSGTSHSRSHSVGYVGGNVGGTTSSTTNTVTQSTLAKKLAAPKKKPTILVLIGFAFLMLFAWGIFGKILGTLGAAALGYFAFVLYTKNVAYNTTVWPGLFADWDQSFYCHRCENVFKL